MSSAQESNSQEQEPAPVVGSEQPPVIDEYWRYVTVALQPYPFTRNLEGFPTAREVWFSLAWTQNFHPAIPEFDAGVESELQYTVFLDRKVREGEQVVVQLDYTCIGGEVDQNLLQHEIQIEPGSLSQTLLLSSDTFRACEAVCIRASVKMDVEQVKGYALLSILPGTTAQMRTIG